jgi:hypothetical protein
MGTQMLFQERVRFSTPHPANLLWLENHGGAPVIRAMRDNFSSREKLFFLRYLPRRGTSPIVTKGYYGLNRTPIPP